LHAVKVISELQINLKKTKEIVLDVLLHAISLHHSLYHSLNSLQLLNSWEYIFRLPYLLPYMSSIFCLLWISDHRPICCNSYSVKVYCAMLYTLLQRVSIACYAKRCISYRKFCPSVRLSVRPSHAGTASKRLKLRSWGLHCRI